MPHVIVLLLIFDVGVALVVMSFQLFDRFGMTETEANPVAQQTAAYIANNGVQFLIVMGTLTLLLLINWNKYAKKGRDNRKNDFEMQKK